MLVHEAPLSNTIHTTPVGALPSITLPYGLAEMVCYGGLKLASMSGWQLWAISSINELTLACN